MSISILPCLLVFTFNGTLQGETFAKSVFTSLNTKHSQMNVRFW